MFLGRDMELRMMTKSKTKLGTVPALETYKYPDQFGDWLGYKVVSFDAKKNTAKVRLSLRDDHLSPARRIHGGVVAAFLDFACGAAVFTTLAKNELCSTVELKVNYLKPLFSEDILTANSEVVFRGRRLCVVRALVYRNKEKAAVALATATFNIATK